MDQLYHGTLARNIPSIQKTGLLPQRSVWTAKFHAEATELVYAVDQSRIGRLTVIITGQMASSDLIEYSADYQFGQFVDDLARHGAIVVLRPEKFRCCSDFSEKGHPQGVEPGDWYSDQAVSTDDIRQTISGPQIIDWLKPHPMDFELRFRNILRQKV